jgi:hypothetical protein
MIGDCFRPKVTMTSISRGLAGAEVSRHVAGAHRPRKVTRARWDELTTSFENEFIASWRVQNVSLPDPESSGTLHDVLVGLTGLTLEIRVRLELSALSREQAELAARYGIRELNAFPSWFGDLYA